MTTTEQQTDLRPYVVHTVGDASETIQTPGMTRLPAVVPGKGDTTKIWMGKVTAAPREKGPPHTHLEAETAAYVLKGHVRVYFGENFEEWIEAGPGDFIFVPANTPHIEENPSTGPETGATAHRGERPGVSGRRTSRRACTSVGARAGARNPWW